MGDRFDPVVIRCNVTMYPDHRREIIGNERRRTRRRRLPLAARMFDGLNANFPGPQPKDVDKVLDPVDHPLGGLFTHDWPR